MHWIEREKVRSMANSTGTCLSHCKFIVIVQTLRTCYRGLLDSWLEDFISSEQPHSLFNDD